MTCSESAHGPLEPRTVELSDDRPRNPRIAIRVAAIKEVLVVQITPRCGTPPAATTPLQNLLRPVHAHVVVHPAGVDHLHLRCIPQLVVRLGVLELPLRVQHWPGVIACSARVR